MFDSNEQPDHLYTILGDKQWWDRDKDIYCKTNSTLKCVMIYLANQSVILLQAEVATKKQKYTDK